MKVLVAIKRVIDHNVKVRVNAENTAVDQAHVKMAMNPFCEIAVEEAVRLKEKGIASETVAVTIGPQAAQEQLRAALALGIDRVIHIETEEALESLAVAKLLKVIAEEEQPGLVLLGKQSIDTDNNQTGQMLSALLGWAQGTYASELSFEHEGYCVVTREIDDGLETLSLRLPAVVTVDLRLNEPRYARLPAIMKAKKKPIDTRQAADMGIDLTPHLERLSVELPPERQAGVMVDSVDELIDRLKNEAKVLS
ncbi:MULTISPECIES: electron transfer flavoprotein subunit beta/FixA family protein [Zymobacter]|uniref:Electron transfer flavoprotein subunit beta n=1 Tax=Zymobacter palmae TaxID=33074 RepID=A0A348HGG1_9GAMM|nr:electron transfer flavoprotein subunit beta/FixA family protein [Zymobacter palmae]BBG30713.1 electron transfer flavoprotein, beta subunit [Zymobacter palmae]